MTAIIAENIEKSYGSKHAVRGINLTIKTGEVYGLLGPNGAGKSTTMYMLVGHLKSDAGTIDVLGFDIKTQFSEINKYIGFVPQDLVFYEKLTVEENLKHFSKLFEIKESNRVIDRLIGQMQMEEFRKRRAENLSGGQKRRLNLAIGLLNKPKLLFLDEPSAGMDPQSRNILWENVQRLAAENVTIVLTTHLMEVADKLCNRIGIIDQGKVLIEGTPDELKGNNTEGTVITLQFADTVSEETRALFSKEIESSVRNLREEDGKLKFHTSDVTQSSKSIFDLLTSLNISITQMNIRESTLEDAFLHLTGTELREGASV